MKNKKNTKRIIGKNAQAERTYLNEGAIKIKNFTEAKRMVQNHIEDFNPDEFVKEGFVAYTTRKLKDKNVVFEGLPQRQLFNLLEIELTLLTKLDVEFKRSKIELINNNTEVAPFDANIYADTPAQIERLDAFEDLVKALNKIEALDGNKRNMMQLNQALGVYDNLRTGEVNIQWIKNAR